MEKLWKYGNFKILKGILIVMCAIIFFVLNKSICYADATGKVTAPSAKIREAASINSEVIASSQQGKTVTITAEVTDASGTLWYEVYVDANTKGYIRSDLVEKDASSGTVPSRTEQGTTTAQPEPATETAPQASAAGAEVPAETEMPAQYASVKVPAAKIRGGASTTSGIVDTIPQNTQIIISGQTNGNDGNVWYYITFTGTGGQEKTGYVRNDLIELGELVSSDVSEQNPENNVDVSYEPEEELENKDYEVVYEETEDGGVWYLYNNLENKKQKLEELLEAANNQQLNESADTSTIKKLRIVIIILVVVIIFAAFIMTIMFFKLRDAYYEAYEENNEEETVEKPIKTKRENVETPQNVKSEPKEPPAKKKPIQTEKKMPVKEVTYEEEPETQIKPAPKKKAKNFMIDDEDFEFEFLNMQNKEGN